MVLAYAVTAMYERLGNKSPAFLIIDLASLQRLLHNKQNIQQTILSSFVIHQFIFIRSLDRISKVLFQNEKNNNSVTWVTAERAHVE